MFSRLWLAAALTLVCTLVGCQRQGPKTTPWYLVKTPSIEVVSVNLVEQTDEGARIEVTTRLNNPNDVALPLKQYRVTLDLPDRPAVSFRDIANRTLPAEGSQTVTMPLALATPPGASLSGDRYQVRGWLNYEPPGEFRKLLTESYIPLPGTSFSTEGELQSAGVTPASPAP